MNKLTLSALALTMTLGLAACGQEDSEGVDMEKAADNAADIADDAGDSMEETYRDVTGQEESAWDKTKDAASNVGEEIEEGAEDVGDAIEDGYEDATSD